MIDDASSVQRLSPEQKRELLRSLLQKERGGSRIAPVSFAQQRLWFLEDLEDMGSTYHIALHRSFRGALDAGALRRALGRIVARHEILRTTFGRADGKPVQRIAAPGPDEFPLAAHDLRDAPDPRTALRALLEEESRARFDLAAGPLIRGRLARVADDEHVLVLTMHHIVSDGWSMGVFARELGVLYDAFRAGRDDPLPPLPTQYADYAAWQRTRVQGPRLERQASYWERTLAGAPERLELPTDRPRPPKQDFGGATVPLALDAELSDALRALSRRHGTTLFMTLLAAWAVVLGRLSGQDDVVVGTPTAGRERREFEDLIGFFVQTLALRVDLTGAPTVAELLARVRARAIEAQENQDIPFEQVVERVRPARSLAHSPLFQVMFAWQNAPAEDGGVGLAGVDAGAVPAPASKTAKFDLSLTLWEAGARIEGGVEYATALFDRPTVERHVGYLRRVLEAMAADERLGVDALPLLSPEETRTLVEGWGRAGEVDPGEGGLHAWFQAHARRAPGAAAVVDEGRVLSYGALDARADKLARHLASLGVGPDARVVVCAHRSPELIVALLAVLKAGGAYVPVDPAHPDERLRGLLHDSAPAAVLAHAELAPRFADAGVPVVPVDDPAAWGGGRAELPDTASPEQAAYVIYTSGSTGRPKGVVVSHRSVRQQVAALQAALDLRPDDRVLHFASFTFDMSVAEIFGALCSGAALVLRSDAWLESAPAFWARCARHGVTYIDIPTRFWQLLAAEPAAEIPACVRVLVAGGEAVDRAAVEAWARRGGHRPRLLNGYGPTEATVTATLREMDDVAAWRSIGRPMPGVRAYLADPRGTLVPTGAVGEILLGGGQVARGYLGRPALTAERFVPDPLGGEAGARLYRTGDLGRWAADGTIEFAGRTDLQVKIRGFRIEPGEIEARLREHPAVREAGVVAREDAPGEKRLVAYHVGDAAAEALRAHLADRLPAYMVPAAYVRLEALPLTPSGKLDRDALPAPDDAAFARRAHEPPRGTTEEALADIWAELLDVEEVGRRDHFFDLGGHSLLAVRLVSRVREALNPEVTLDDVFAHPTLQALAARLDGKVGWLGTDHAVPVRETGSERPLFVVHDMTGLVAYAQLLRPHLDAEIPIYALSGPLLSTDEVSSMDDLVDRLVRMMSEVQPEGPYRLVGWSAGGVFAYAVAQRLVESGQEVEFVGMLDASHPAPKQMRVAPRARMRVVYELLARDSAAPAPTPESLRALGASTAGMELPAFIATCHARGLLPESVTVARAEQMYDRIALLRRTSSEFVPGPLPVPVYIFATEDAGRADPRLGWRDLPGGAPLRLERVPGAHVTMWRKGNVEALGAALSRAIRACAGSTTVPG